MQEKTENGLHITVDKSANFPVSGSIPLEQIAFCFEMFMLGVGVRRCNHRNFPVGFLQERFDLDSAVVRLHDSEERVGALHPFWLPSAVNVGNGA